MEMDLPLNELEEMIEEMKGGNKQRIVAKAISWLII
jgi:hypothetical protein